MAPPLNRRQSLTVALASWLAMHGYGWAQSDWLEVVTSGRDGPYDEVLAVLQRELAGLRVAVDTQVPTSHPAGVPRAVLTLGVQALRSVLNRSVQPAWRQVPVLAGLLPEAAFALHAAQLPSGSSAILLDQPLERMLAVARAAWPDQPRVGVLMGPAAAAQEAQLERAARLLERRLVKSTLVTSTKDLYPALSEVLSRVDVLLALPDALVWNADTLQFILQAAYRQRVPLISYSLAHVRAGATVGLYAAPAQVGLQMAMATQRLWSGSLLPRPALAQDFTLAVNAQVARSLGLNLPDPAVLEAAVRRREGQR